MSHAANDVAGPAAKVDFALGYDKLRVFSWTTRVAAYRTEPNWTGPDCRPVYRYLNSDASTLNLATSTTITRNPEPGTRYSSP